MPVPGTSPARQPLCNGNRDKSKRIPGNSKGIIIKRTHLDQNHSRDACIHLGYRKHEEKDIGEKEWCDKSQESQKGNVYMNEGFEHAGLFRPRAYINKQKGKENEGVR